MKRKWLLSMVPAGLLACAQAYAADAYPTRAIRMIVPFAAGGAADIIARLMSARMTETLGQPIVIDTRPGGGTVLGTEIVARANPDGHTVGMLATSLALNTGLLSKIPYDSVKDFAPITLAVDTPLIIVVPAALPVKTLAEFIALAKTKPNRVAYGSSGQGTSGHLANELLSYRTGITMLHVPYKGAGPALIDLIGGQVQMVCTSTLPALPHVRSGHLRGLAVTTAARTRAAPDVPTVAEAASLPGYRASTWYALFAPRGVPRDIVARLSGEIEKVLNQPEVKDKVIQLGAEPSYLGGDRLLDFVTRDSAKWGKLIRDTGSKTD